jgi:hypothetical protein
MNKGDNKSPEHRAKGKAKLICQQTDKISQQPENWQTAMALTWYRQFQRNDGLNKILRGQASHFHYVKRFRLSL